jgi:hypothetical protein
MLLYDFVADLRNSTSRQRCVEILATVGITVVPVLMLAHCAICHRIIDRIISQVDYFRQTALSKYDKKNDGMNVNMTAFR